MAISQTILLGLVIVAAITALGIGGYLLYRKLSSNNSPPVAEKYAKSKENFEVKVSPRMCQLLDISDKQPEGWLCFTTLDSTKKRCCPLEENINACDVNGKEIPSGDEGRYHDSSIGLNKDMSELKLFNRTKNIMKVNYLSSRDSKNDKPKYLATITPNSFIYIYKDNEGFSFEPDYVFYANVFSVVSKEMHLSNSEMKFKPYVLGEEDYEIDFEPIISLEKYGISSEIPALYIINKSFQPQDIYYKNKYLGRVSDFSYEKMEHEYSLFTDNNHNGFAVGSNIETRKLKDKDGKSKHSSRPEYITLKDKNMTTLSID